MSLQLIRRAEWGARRPRSVSHNLDPRGVACHYEGPKLGVFPHSSCATKVRGIQRYHMDTKRWADIAYNFVVCPHGYVFEGRGLGVRSAAQGSNNGNLYYYAVCGLWGKGDDFTEAAKVAYSAVIAYIRHNGAGNDVRPHNYFRPTQCPGDPVIKWIANGMPVSQQTDPQSSLNLEGSHVISPPLTIKAVSYLIHPETGGVALLQEDGGIFCFNCPFNGNTVGKSYMGDGVHVPQRLVRNPQWSPGSPNPWYIVVDQHGHEYGHQGF